MVGIATRVVILFNLTDNEVFRPNVLQGPTRDTVCTGSRDSCGRPRPPRTSHSSSSLMSRVFYTLRSTAFQSDTTIFILEAGRLFLRLYTGFQNYINGMFLLPSCLNRLTSIHSQILKIQQTFTQNGQDKHHLSRDDGRRCPSCGS